MLRAQQQRALRESDAGAALDDPFLGRGRGLHLGELRVRAKQLVGRQQTQSAVDGGTARMRAEACESLLCELVRLSSRLLGQARLPVFWRRGSGGDGCEALGDDAAAWARMFESA